MTINISDKMANFENRQIKWDANTQGYTVYYQTINRDSVADSNSTFISLE